MKNTTCSLSRLLKGILMVFGLPNIEYSRFRHSRFGLPKSENSRFGLSSFGLQKWIFKIKTCNSWLFFSTEFFWCLLFQVVGMLLPAPSLRTVIFWQVPVCLFWHPQYTSWTVCMFDCICNKALHGNCLLCRFRCNPQINKWTLICHLICNPLHV